MIDTVKLRGWLERAGEAWRAYVTASDLRNAAIPDYFKKDGATPAERALFDERELALKERQREFRNAAHDLGKFAGENAALLDTLDAMQGWRSIDSAPKDGTPILIFDPNRTRKDYMPIGALKEGECSYSSDDPRLLHYDDERYAIGYWRPWGGWGNRNCARVTPTHWQPLPLPPSDPTIRHRGRG